MGPNAMIEAYVDDVVRRLPRRLRADVGSELSSLLHEELAGRAAAAGRAPDEAMAIDLLRSFGAPADMAERYGPAGFTVLRPSEAPGFALVAFSGVLLQWAFTLPAFFAQAGSVGAALGGLGGWWLTLGIGAFWWPGFMICATIVAAWLGRSRTEGDWSPPPAAVDPDRISRPWLSLALTFWLAGAAFWVALPWITENGPAGLRMALSLDPTFLAQRAPWLLPLWAAHFVVLAVVIWRGRWSATLRAVSAWLTLAICALLVWYLLAGPVFVSRAADQMVKLIAVLIVIGSLMAEGARVLRRTPRLRQPAAA